MPAVQDVSFQVRRGETAALLGLSGCGKSTILKAVAGFLRPAAGRVLIGGKPVVKPGPDQPFDPPVILLNDVVQVFALPQPREAPQVTSPLHVGHCTWAEMAKVSSAKPMECHRREAAFLSTVMVRGLTVCGWASALRKKRLVDAASRCADSKKSMVWPRLSTARYS